MILVQQGVRIAQDQILPVQAEDDGGFLLNPLGALRHILYSHLTGGQSVEKVLFHRIGDGLDVLHPLGSGRLEYHPRCGDRALCLM